MPQAISITRAPWAHAARQSRWHCLKGGCISSFSATGEGAAALNLTALLWGMRGGQGIHGKATATTAGPKCRTKPRPAYHLGFSSRKTAPTNTHLHSSPLQLFPPTFSLFMVRFVMTRCSASEFSSQAFTFWGNRRLLVTTVHLGACRKLAAQGHQNGLGGRSSQHEQSEKCQLTASINITKMNFRCVVGGFFPSLSVKPLQCSPHLSGLVDPPCHAQEAPHLLEENRRVPAANGMGTVQTQQVQACWHRVSDGI